MSRRSRGAHRRLTLAVTLGLFITTIGCIGTGSGGTRGAERDGAIVVGVSGAFAENQIVAEMYAQVLEHAGYAVERQLDLRSREISQNALESGQIDLKPEYLSSLLLFVDPNAEPSNESNDAVVQMYVSGKSLKEHVLSSGMSWSMNEAILTMGQATADNLDRKSVV